MVVAGPALAGIVGLGAVGGILANIALTPLTAGASLLQSYWYGSGLILGERMMYTVHWEKIKGRLDKGEDFLQVLDKIMNDDITAIANLSFKAMDETGKLYLAKAGTGLADFVEKLLLAIIKANPLDLLDGGETEPPPEGEPTPTGISLTIEEIQAMSVNTLLFETQASQITKYTPATQAHMLTELAKRQLEKEEEKEKEEIIQLQFNGLLEEEKEYASLLNVTTIQNVWQFLLTLPSTLQTKISTEITPLGYWFSTQVRTRSAGSDQVLNTYANALFRTRKQWYTNVERIDINFDLPLFQENVFLWLFMMHIHQLIYSRG